jgi:hypothetical protein
LEREPIERRWPTVIGLPDASLAILAAIGPSYRKGRGQPEIPETPGPQRIALEASPGDGILHYTLMPSQWFEDALLFLSIG